MYFLVCFTVISLKKIKVDIIKTKETKGKGSSREPITGKLLYKR